MKARTLSQDEIIDQAMRYRANNKKVVIVQGLGFVGAALASVIANALDENDRPLYFVIGVDLPSIEGKEKIAKINSGDIPFSSPDPEFKKLVYEGVYENGNFVATDDDTMYGLGDIIIITVPVGIKNIQANASEDIEVDWSMFTNGLAQIGATISSNTLVIVETTVPVGTCRSVVYPLLMKELRKRVSDGRMFLAHSFERVMPGPTYIDSIRNYWRVISGIDPLSFEQAKRFYETLINTDEFPLSKLGKIEGSELAKLLENSYRALNIAFIEEWSRFAEEIEINLFEVIKTIRERKGTHDNMMFPGFGVGGYCLPKDPLLAQWSASKLSRQRINLTLTMSSQKINYFMPLQAFHLLKKYLGGKLERKRILVCGITYLPDVSDVRYSPSKLLVENLLNANADVMIYDPYILSWNEFPNLAVVNKLPEEKTSPIHGLVLAVRHGVFRDSLTSWIATLPSPLPLVIDANNVLSDEDATMLWESGCRVVGVGKGHWLDKFHHEEKS